MGNTFKRVISTTCPTSTGTVDYTVAGLGPVLHMKGVEVEACYATALDTDTDGKSGSRGFSDGTNMAVLSWAGEHGVTTSDEYTYSDSGTTTGTVLALLSPTDGSIVAEAVFNRWIENGVRLNWITPAPSSAWRLTVILTAGPDVECDVQIVNPSDSASGSVTVTPGYTAETNLVLALAGSATTAFDGTLESNSATSIGVCTNDGTTVSQNAIGQWVNDGATTTDVSGIVHTGRLATHVESGLSGVSYTAGSFNASTGAFDIVSTGFGANSAERLAVMMFHFPSNISVKTYSHGYPTSTGTTAFTDPGFRPQYIWEAPTPINALDAIRTNGLGSSFGLCHADNAGVEMSMAWADEDGVSTSNTQSVASQSALKVTLHTGLGGYVATVDSWDASGFTLDFSAVIGASTRYGIGYAVEEELELYEYADESADADDAAATEIGLEEPVVETADAADASAAEYGVPVSDLADSADASTAEYGVPAAESADSADAAAAEYGAPVAEAADADDALAAEYGAPVVDSGDSADAIRARYSLPGNAEPADAQDSVAFLITGPTLIGGSAYESAEARSSQIAQYLVSLQESADAEDLTAFLIIGLPVDIETSLLEQLDVSDTVRHELAVVVVRGLVKPAATAGSHYTWISQPSMPTPLAVVQPPGVGGAPEEDTVVERADAADTPVFIYFEADEAVWEDFAYSDDEAVGLIFTTIDSPVVESGDSADSVTTDLYERITDTSVDSGDASDVVVALLEDDTTPGGFNPPDIGFDQSFFDEPMEIDATFDHLAFNQIDGRDLVTQVADSNAPSEEWRGLGNALQWKVKSGLHSRMHVKALDQGYPNHRAYCVKLQTGSSVHTTLGDFEYIHFWDVGFYNESENDFVNGQGQTVGLAAQFTVDCFGSNPFPIENDQTYVNHPQSPTNPGVHAFHRCEFRIPCGPEEVNCNPTLGYAGFGVKMNAHQQAPHDNLFDRCVFRSAQEHSIYSEWVQRMHVRDCFFEATGGNAIQVASRVGRYFDANALLQYAIENNITNNPFVWARGTFYSEGNRIHMPSGLNGWALIENSTINANWFDFRDSHEISFFGFLGPIVIRNVNINNSIGGVAIETDMGKGMWVANGVDIPWSQPVYYYGRPAANQVQAPWDPPYQDPPIGTYSTPGVWIDNVSVRRQPSGVAPGIQKAAFTFGGAKEIHIGRFFSDYRLFGQKTMAFNEFGKRPYCKNKPGTPEDPNDPDYLPNVTFYDTDSLQPYISGGTVNGLGKWVPDNQADNRFQAFTLEELDYLTEGGLP